MQAQIKWLREYFDSHIMPPELQDTVETLREWTTMVHGYQSKNDRLLEWLPEEKELYAIADHILAMCLLHPAGITYQALIGAIANHVRCVSSLDRAKTAAEMIALAYQCELVVITKTSDKTMVVTTDHRIPDPIPRFIEHMPQFDKPGTVQGIPILGSRLKKHAGDVCTDHINRMNAIPLALEFRIIDSMPETTTNIYETPEQVDAWDTFVENSREVYELIRQRGNHFYLEHSNDTRGRCYASGYCVGYQGSSYKKAIVQLANKEIVKL